MTNAIDHRLSRRRFEAHSPDFAERIILQAHRTEQRERKGVMLWLEELLQPRFAYAFAAMLMMGFVIGTALPAPMATEDTSVTLQSWLHEEGDML